MTNYSEVAGLPFEIGGSVRYVDNRFGDNANQVNLSSYTLVDFLQLGARQITVLQ